MHILSGTIIFGTGIGIAYFKWTTDRTRDVRAIRIASERTVMADWIFTTPAVVFQPVSGIAVMHLVGYPLTTPWILVSLFLYILAGACWLPVVWLQIRMRDLSRTADQAGSVLPENYWRLNRIWFALGVPAFSALVAVYWLMVAKPSL
jgi:uncharacterized membrane protein